VVGSCRFYGYFRGPLVINSDADVYLEAKRFESFSESRKQPGVFNGCGLCDCEGFGGDPDDFGYIRLLFADGWAESDFDEASRQHDSQRKSWTRLYGCHTTGAAFQFKHDSSSDGWAAYPISEVFSKYCTWSYWRRGHGGGNFPPSLLGSLGPGDAGLGLLSEGTVFIANGDPYCHHEDSLLYTTNDLSTCEITYLIAASNTEPGGRKVTLRNCEFRVKNLPSGLTTANTRCFWWPATFPAAFELEFDGVLIDSAFADTPFNLGGATIRYRNVLHERTNDTTPWTNYTSEVLIT
jgi:hypothetical protein